MIIMNNTSRSYVLSIITATLLLCSSVSSASCNELRLGKIGIHLTDQCKVAWRIIGKNARSTIEVSLPNDDESYIFWADLALVVSDQILFELVDYQLVKKIRLGEERVPPASAILDMSSEELCIPIVHYRWADDQSEKLWAQLKLDDSDSRIRFKVVDYGVWNSFEPKCQ
ncbi:secreted protein [Candidatus Thiomargarita nelsonii]|uniref:Secreted protein n=1 Tax=Candidatus Thiomargarita nelsonii TaxID=1003181 RepID=A0A176RTT1_9GAMM|nr:secreted protein [Candidatus Thiomargarita nelsonii]